jgi:uncharacterized membrane protein YagU involved in acid resistance
MVYMCISDVTLRCTVRLTVLRYGTVITVHHCIFYGFSQIWDRITVDYGTDFGTVLKSPRLR